MSKLSEWKIRDKGKAGDPTEVIIELLEDILTELKRMI